MVKENTSKKSSSVEGEKPPASIKKKKLGDQSLDWITDTTDNEEILSEQAESGKSASAGKSKEKKIGVLKQYVSGEAEKRKDDSPDILPAIFGNSSTITKGEKAAPVKKGAAQKTGEIEEADGIKQETEHEKKTGEVITAAKEDSPIEVGKTYKITGEKELVSTEEEKSASVEEESEPKTEKVSVKPEVRKAGDTTTEGKAKIEESAMYISEGSSLIVKKKDRAESGKPKKKVKAKSEKKEEKKEAVKDEAVPVLKEKKSRTSIMFASLKTGGRKVSQTIEKPLKSVKPGIKKTYNAVIDASKHPVKTISSVDREITKSMKKAVFPGKIGFDEKQAIKDFKSIDAHITKSVKKLIDSILG